MGTTTDNNKLNAKLVSIKVIASLLLALTVLSSGCAPDEINRNYRGPNLTSDVVFRQSQSDALVHTVVNELQVGLLTTYEFETESHKHLSMFALGPVTDQVTYPKEQCKACTFQYSEPATFVANGHVINLGTVVVFKGDDVDAEFLFPTSPDIVLVRAQNVFD